MGFFKVHLVNGGHITHVIFVNGKKYLKFVLMKEIGRSMTVGDVENERVCEVWRSVGAK